MKPPGTVVMEQVEAAADESASALLEAFHEARGSGDFISAKASAEESA